MSGSGIVCVQHEFGIFGGKQGAFLEETLKNLKRPVVLTMHTVLKNPDEEMKKRTQAFAVLCEAIVVLSKKAKRFLVEIYGIPEKKIYVIYHGVPDVPFIDPNYYKDKFGVEGRTVLLSFGFLSENKGIETAIRALPAVVKKHPDLVYIIQGVTHPNILQERGEEYRFKLKRLIKVLGLEKNVYFINSYLKLKELTELIGASNIYITPYLNKEQISSGTLAYAVGAGKAVVSTPYFCAEELLADGRGALFNFNDSETLNKILMILLSDKKKIHQMRKKAYALGRRMIWPEVGKKYVLLFNKVIKDYIPVSKNKAERKKKEIYEDLPELSFIHLKRMTDDVALIQHAKYSVPDRKHGYSTDDSSRALPLVLSQYMQTKDKVLLEMARRYLAFLHHSQTENGLFHNFMSYDRRFLDEVGGEDTQGRIIWGLGFVIFAQIAATMSRLAKEMFDRVFASAKFTHPQSKAYAMCGCYYYLKKFSGATAVVRAMEKHADDLVKMYRLNAKPDWKWFEERITYGRAKICHALLLAYKILGKEKYLKVALESLDFLTRICIRNGTLSIIGNQGWQSKGEKKPNFDQQPIDAWYLIEAYDKAYEITEKSKY
ncbi:glycosyltransferase, partial [Candidatus Woesearchaeota archaeon]|nr:glycosyltransferase [Candidatus Woesearchaeota archaeon]